MASAPTHQIASTQGRRGLWLTFAMGFAFAVMWSSAFSVAKVVLEDAPPYTVLTLRFLMAAVLAGGIAMAVGQPLPRGRAVWGTILVLGLCQNTLYLGLMFEAMTSIPAGLAAIVASAMPLVVAALAPMLIAERVGPIKTAGLVTGFVGVVWIMGTRVAGGVELLPLGIAVVGVLALSTATLTVKRGDFGTGLLMVVACQMLVGAVGCLPVALLLEDVTAITPTVTGMVGFAYLVIVPGILATFVWFTLVKRTSAANASAFHFLNPILGVGIAFLLLAEPVGWNDAIGVVLVAAGILIVNRAR